MRKNIKKQSEQGFTLIELAIVVGVMAVLSTVVLAGKGFMDSTAVSKSASSITQLSSAASHYLATQKNRSFSTTADENLLTTLGSRKYLTLDDGDLIFSAGVSTSAVTGQKVDGKQMIAFELVAPDAATGQDIAGLLDLASGTVGGTDCVTNYSDDADTNWFCLTI